MFDIAEQRRLPEAPTREDARKGRPDDKALGLGAATYVHFHAHMLPLLHLIGAKFTPVLLLNSELNQRLNQQGLDAPRI